MRQLQAGISHYTTAKHCSPNHIPTLTPNMNPVSVTGTCICIIYNIYIYMYIYMYTGRTMYIYTHAHTCIVLLKRLGGETRRSVNKNSFQDARETSLHLVDNEHIDVRYVQC